MAALAPPGDAPAVREAPRAAAAASQLAVTGVQDPSEAEGPDMPSNALAHNRIGSADVLRSMLAEAK